MSEPLTHADVHGSSEEKNQRDKLQLVLKSVSLDSRVALKRNTGLVRLVRGDKEKRKTK